MNFRTLYAKEPYDIDGILGFVVHPDKKKQDLSYVWNLKNMVLSTTL